MKVKVERCSNEFRLTMPCGSREFISYHGQEIDGWDRRYATEALNMLEAVYKVNRKAVRFEHH